MHDEEGRGNMTARGRGLFQGLDCVSGELADKITSFAFNKGLTIETSGTTIMYQVPVQPLTISDENLKGGLEIVKEEGVREAPLKLTASQ